MEPGAEGPAHRGVLHVTERGDLRPGGGVPRRERVPGGRPEGRLRRLEGAGVRRGAAGGPAAAGGIASPISDLRLSICDWRPEHGWHGLGPICTDRVEGVDYRPKPAARPRSGSGESGGACFPRLRRAAKWLTATASRRAGEAKVRRRILEVSAAALLLVAVAGVLLGGYYWRTLNAALREALDRGDAPAVKTLLRRGARVRQTGSRGEQCPGPGGLDRRQRASGAGTEEGRRPQ